MKNRPPPLRNQTKHTDILLPEKDRRTHNDLQAVASSRNLVETKNIQNYEKKGNL